MRLTPIYLFAGNARLPSSFIKIVFMLTYGKSPMAEQVPPKWHEKKGCREAGYNSRSLHPKASESTSWSSPLRTRSPGGGRPSSRIQTASRRKLESEDEHATKGISRLFRPRAGPDPGRDACRRTGNRGNEETESRSGRIYSDRFSTLAARG